MMKKAIVLTNALFRIAMWSTCNDAYWCSELEIALQFADSIVRRPTFQSYANDLCNE